MKRVILGVIAVLLVGAALPVMAAVAPPARVDDVLAKADAYLSDQLEAGSADPLLVVVRGTSYERAVAASKQAGLDIGPGLERINATVASGTVAQITSLLADRDVVHVGGDRPIHYDQQTSHKATRGEDAANGFVGYRLEEQPPIPGTTTKKCGRSPERRNGRRTGERKCTTTTTPEQPVPPIERAVDVAGVNGSGVSIAIVDSGVDGTHPMFQDGDASRVVRNLRLVCPFCEPGSMQESQPTAFVDMGDDYNNSDLVAGGHGTHVASIAAGGAVTTADGRDLHGAATGAKVISLGMGANNSIIAANLGLEWVLEHHEQPCGPDVPADVCPPIKVVNNSWGSGAGEHDPQDANSLLSDELVDEGVVVVFAHGNDGGDGSENMGNPEAQNTTPGVIAVASVDDHETGIRDEVTVSDFSSRGKKGEGWTYPDISAPGSNILGACRPYMNPIYGCNSIDVDDPNFGTIGGTSMAAPHVTGIVAQLFQAAANAGKTLTPAEVERIIETTGYKFGEPYEVAADGSPKSSFDRGHGLIDAKAAVAAVHDLYLKDPSAPPAPADCVAGRVVVDDEGDGTTSSTDVVATSMAWDATAKTVTFALDVADLGTEYAATYTGEGFYVDFVLGGKPYFVSANRSMTEEPTGSFGRLESTADGGPGVRSALSSEGMTATFDAEGDVVTVVLTQAAIDDANATTLNDEGAPVAPLADGVRFASIAVETNLTRDVRGTGLLTASDDARSGCDYVLASGSQAPAPTPAAPEEPPTGGDPSTVATQGSASLGAGESATFEGTPAAAQDAYQCTGPGDPVCFTYAIDVAPTDESFTLTAVVEADPLTTDYDVSIYDAQGTRVFGGLNAGLPQTLHEKEAVDVAAGRYYVVVQPYTATPDTPFTLEVTLTGCDVDTAVLVAPREPELWFCALQP